MSHSRPFHLFLTAPLVVAPLVALQAPALDKETDSCTQQLYKSFPHFPTKLCPSIPINVVQEIVCDKVYEVQQQQCVGGILPEQLKDPAKFARMKRHFELLAWQTFIGVNWPVDKENQRLRSFTDKGVPAWHLWSSPEDVFASTAGSPSGPSATRPLALQDINLGVPHLNSTQQVFNSGILYDQNGNKVYYEVLLNPTLTNFIQTPDNRLNTLDGQLAYYQQNPSLPQTGLLPPWNNKADPTQPGAMTMKLAWKQLTSTDDPSRYYTTHAYIEDQSGKPSLQKVALVGMHIANNIRAANRKWIWMTFEHVDNLRVNALEHGTGSRFPRPSFFNSDCPTCPVNTEPTAPDGDGRRRTQVARTLPIDPDTEELNRQVRGLLKQLGSFWQHYELVGIQWPADPSSPPAPPTDLVGSLTNRSGGSPSPAFLVNSTLETYLQAGNQPVGAQGSAGSAQDRKTLFATSSCMGCHSGASIAGTCLDGKPVWGAQFTGGFIWQFRQAKWSSEEAKKTACQLQ